ncbi:MAG: DNA gyrase subunit A, partial [Negativicoccus succinicivorans]|nr:DNA gyrase subunit A [Negativicoccus succinicivorans]
HGNFGSVDGDSPAAMRYTEVRMAKIAQEMLEDLEKNTVDFMPNYDESLQEPVVLPSKIPNLLVNGSYGIAVGMATNIPPHNLGEVVDGLCLLIDDPNTPIETLMKHIKGPDFPTGGLIQGREGIKKAYTTGRGAIKVRARVEIEEMAKGKNRIVVTEIPYQVNKARVVETIAKLSRDKILDGITALRDESDRNGMRIVIELRSDIDPQIMLNNLYKHTQLQETFGVIMLALVDGHPRVLTLKQMLEYYLLHQKEVITRRSQYELDRARAREHIVEGLLIALDHIDAIIKTIRASETDEIAKNALMENFGLSEKQSLAILDMRLRRLTGLEREKLEAEYQDLKERIEYLLGLLGDEAKVMQVVKEELLDVKQR